MKCLHLEQAHRSLIDDILEGNSSDATQTVFRSMSVDEWVAKPLWEHLPKNRITLGS